MAVDQRKSGSWRVRVMVNGRSATGTTVTRKAAKLLEARLLTELGRRPAAHTTTLAEMIQLHLEEHPYSATLNAEYVAVQRHLPDRLGTIPVTELGTSDISLAYRHLERQGVAVYPIRRLHELIRSALKLAQQWSWIDTNPAQAAKVPRAPDRDIRPPTPDEVAALFDHATGDWATYLRLAVSTGARRGEMVALQWHDINFDTSDILIRRAAAATTVTGVILKDIKTGSKGHRHIALDLPTATALRRMRTHRNTVALELGLIIPPNAFVFSDDLGQTCWRPDSATHRFDTTRTAAGVTGVRLHDLRHFTATQLLSAGVPIHVVAGRLGQSNTATTERYGWFIPASDRAATDGLSDIIETARNARRRDA